ncbi:MAG: MBL fold metallo-hydrolase [Candidatus Saccharimonadales bacterium]
MFDIEYKGGNSVVITTKKAILVVDPKLSLAGLKDISVKGAVQLGTEERLLVDSKGTRLTVEGPGEYEVADLSIHGVPAVRHIDTPDQGKKATIYRIEVGDVRIALLGNIADKLEEEQLEGLGLVDVLIIPVGGGYTLDPTNAAALTRQIEAKAVIPIHYKDDALKYEVPQEELSVFATELGAPIETTAKLKVKSAASLPQVLTICEVTRS